MTERDEWSDWIEHDGLGCPVPNGTLVHTIWDAGLREIIAPATGSEGWFFWRPRAVMPGKIIRYRVRKPRALLNLIDMVENLPTPTEREPA